MPPPVLRRISSVAAGRRSKWIVVAVWVILGLALGPLQPKLQDATVNENEAFLPGSADSTRVNDLIEDRFPEGREVDAIVVYNRERGLGPADRARISRDARALCKPDEVRQLLAVIDPISGPVCGESRLAGGDESAAGQPPGGGARPADAGAPAE